MKSYQFTLYTSLNPVNPNPQKWSNTIKQFVGNSELFECVWPTNCLSVFDHFVVLAQKGLICASVTSLKSIYTQYFYSPSFCDLYIISFDANRTNTRKVTLNNGLVRNSRYGELLFAYSLLTAVLSDKIFTKKTGLSEDFVVF